MTDPLRIQEGGDHYKSMVIQPFELSMANNYDSLIHTIIKYVNRHADKNGLEDLRKAIHCCQLRTVLATHTPWALSVIPIETYVRENQIDVREATAIIHAHGWAIGSHNSAEIVINSIEMLIEMRYPNAK